MKQILLWCLFFISSFTVLAQQRDAVPSVFPNPTDSFVQLDRETGIEKLTVYNLVGRKMLSFQVAQGKKYDLSGLPPGMYLIRLVDAKQKIVGTRRVQRR